MEVRVYNYETKQILFSGQMDGIATEDIFRHIAEIERLQETEDILNVGKLGRANFGIQRMYNKGAMATSMDSDSTNIATGTHSFELRPVARQEDTTPPNVTIDGVDVGIKVGVVMYDAGFMLNSGKECHSIFGTGSPAYLKSIGKRNLRCTSASAAKKFKDLKALIQFIEKNYDALHYMVTQYGYCWTEQPSCELFIIDYESSIHGNVKKEQKYQEDLRALDDLLDQINQDEEEIPDDGNIPKEATPETIREEILYRMKKMNFFSCGTLAYKKSGTIFQSEAGGIIYQLDDDAKRAVEEARNCGLTPWHVIRNDYMEIGKIYTVLFVSNDPEEWTYERGDKHGNLTAFCWNVGQQFGEIGNVCVSGANGGLVRAG